MPRARTCRRGHRRAPPADVSTRSPRAARSRATTSVVARSREAAPAGEDAGRHGDDAEGEPDPGQPHAPPGEGRRDVDEQLDDRAHEGVDREDGARRDEQRPDQDRERAERRCRRRCSRGTATRAKPQIARVTKANSSHTNASTSMADSGARMPGSRGAVGVTRGVSDMGSILRRRPRLRSPGAAPTGAGRRGGRRTADPGGRPRRSAPPRARSSRCRARWGEP